MGVRWKITGCLAVAVTLTLLLLPKMVPVCAGLVATAAGGQMPMRCHYTFQAQFLFALTGLFTAGTWFFARSNDARKAIGFLVVLLGVMTLILPQSWVMGICRHDQAPCHDTAFWNSLLSLGQITVGLLMMSCKGESVPGNPTGESKTGVTGEAGRWLD